MFEAFISYSHAADGRLAAALQRNLHRFAKPIFKMRAIRVFRDETTLAMTPQLWPEIEKALRDSRFFILMADPLSAQSEWVQKEVTCWLGMGLAKKMLIVWTGGEVVWSKAAKDFNWERTTALPKLLAGAFDGEEPLYLDLRWARAQLDLSRRHPRFTDAVARLSATIRGRSLDEIFGDDVREQRRGRTFLWAGITALLLATIFAGWRWWGELQARKEADAARLRTSELASQANLSAARYSQDAGNHAQALAYSAQALYPANHRSVALTGALLTENSWAILLANSVRHDAAVTSAQFSPDGQRFVTASQDGTARLCDAQTGQAIGQPMKHTKPVNSAQFSPDGRRIVTASDDATAQLWDAATGQPIAQPLPHRASVISAQFSPDGQRVVTASDDGTAQLWDVASCRSIGQPMRHHKPVNSAQFSPNGQWVVTASKDCTACLWDAATGEQVGKPLQHQNTVWSAQFSPDSQRVVTASGDGMARLWDVATGQSIGNPIWHAQAISSAQFSPDGQRLVTASWDGTARVWDATNGQPIGHPMKHEEAVMTAQFSPDGQRVVTASEDWTARLWDGETGQSISEPMNHRGWVHSAQFSPDGRQVVTASNDSAALLWEAINRKAICETIRYEKSVDSAQFSADGRQVVTASWDGTARLWNAATGRAIGPIGHAASVSPAPVRPDGQWTVTISPDHHWLAVTGDVNGSARLWDLTAEDAATRPLSLKVDGGRIQKLVCSSDNHWLVTVSDDGPLRLWDLTAKNPADHPSSLYGPCSPITAVTISPDNRWLIGGSDYRAVCLWDLTAKEPMARSIMLQGHEGRVDAVAVSPDNHRLVTGGSNGTARLWDLDWNLDAGRAIGEPMRHNGSVTFAQFSSDGQRFVTASQDGTARLWDAQTGGAIGEPMRHDGSVTSARFSPDGQRLVTVSQDGMARLWDIPTVDSKDTLDPEDLALLADLARATGGMTLQPLENSGQVQILNLMPPDQVRATREKIAARFAGLSSNLSPVQRCLKWSVSEWKNRTISPLSEVTVAEWVEDRIRQGAIDDLRTAVQVDPTNPRLAAHFGKALAIYAREGGPDRNKARLAKGEADFQTSRALKLAPQSEEVKKLRAEVVQALHLPE